MDQSKKYENPSPETSANIISRLMFWWIIPFFKYGYQNDLEVKDLYNSTKPDLSENLGNHLEREWYAEVERARNKKKQPYLLTAIRKTFAKPYSFYGIILFLQCVGLKMFQPIVLAEFIRYFDTSRPLSDEAGWILGVSVIVMAFVNVIIMHYTNVENQRIGMRCRVACCSLIYRKLLRLNKISLGDTAAGQLVNLLSNDVCRFDIAPIFLHYIWIMPIQAVVATFILYRSVGWAALAGMLTIAVQAIPMQGYLSKKQGTFRKKIAKATDHRVKLMSEITAGIQVIKMYAWEKPFEKMVELARKNEIKLITLTSYIRGFSMAIMVFTERVTLFLTVVTYVLLGNRLTSDVVFSVAQLFNTVQLYMAIFFPLAIATYAEAKVSVRRLEQFLIKEENKQAVPVITGNDKPGTINLEKAKASWIPNTIVDTLSNINLSVQPGKLVVVVGQVGSGKTSLLQLLLKELPLNSGTVEVHGKISYASQEPWLFVSSVKNNILFGQEFNKQRYRDVVKVCALQRDFEQLPQGDRTLVTERGLSLSGGQRARVNLARAVYREADIYLFDDPLSAVDAHVGKHMFEQCILKYLNNKTRILTTHQLQFLKHADMIVIMNNGQIEKVGAYNELSESELEYLKQEENVTEEEKGAQIEKRERLMSVVSHTSTLADEDEAEPEETQELVEKGTLSKSVYVEYLRAGGFILSVFCGILLLLAQGVTNASDIWLTHWTNTEESYYHSLERFLNNTAPEATNLTNATDAFNDTMEFESTTVESLGDFMLNSTESVNISSSNSVADESYHKKSLEFYTGIYTALIIASILLLTARSFVFYKICMKASRGLHNLMFSNILQATMRFFDTNPSGRILNRFSKDMGSVDELLPKALLDTIQIFLVMAGILAMVFIVNAWMIIPTIILGILFYYLRVIYLSTAQDIKRLEGITKAPVFSHVTASLYGISTIRSSSAQEMVTNEFDVLQDQHTSAWFLFIYSSEAFGMYMDLISVLYLAIVTLQFLILDDGSTLSGNVGLVISQSLILTGMLQYGVRQSAEFVSQLTSVERILQYTKLDKEGPFESLPAKKPHRDWPQNGAIEFKNVTLRYIPEEAPVLKNLNISIKAGEKIGIVGRTGAGKSSLIAALFRLAPIEGEILIDNVDTKTVGLHDLRKNISIIPQEPVLFSASVRYNLDPFNNSDDKALWKALEDVELKEVIPTLDHHVSESGSNFSAGQRQLVCLARAIVRNNNILVMDEATANVDPQTDGLIQKTIRNNFKNCTVLTIAHRLNTIMDSDKVLVMDGGQAVEFDKPHVLLQNSKGYLTSMVQQTGKNMENKLRVIAENTYKEQEEIDENKEEEVKKTQ